ncbi:MAG: exonuclease domain-containing protein [Proteobacteria bacterium]|nr:exonuclease domain-containing protein [Pseudomonadota bacterium]
MGNIRYNTIIICDVESTCWEPREAQGDQPSEVIEIGVCRLHMDTFDISGKTSLIVRPKFSEITEFCTELTGLTWDKVKHGMQFKDACNKLFKKFGTSNKVWASWGDCDRDHFRKECKEKDARYPFGQTHVNVSALFSLSLGKSQRLSVSDALKEIGFEFEGRPHCGADDAYNTARILRYLLEPARNKSC